MSLLLVIVVALRLIPPVVAQHRLFVIATCLLSPLWLVIHVVNCIQLLISYLAWPTWTVGHQDLDNTRARGGHLTLSTCQHTNFGYPKPVGVCRVEHKRTSSKGHKVCETVQCTCLVSRFTLQLKKTREFNRGHLARDRLASGCLTLHHPDQV